LHHARGERSTVTFAELESVIIRTADEGPIDPDVFWVLSGADRTCVVPQGATGEEALIDRLGKLPGFKFEAMIAAMSCARIRSFIVRRDRQMTHAGRVPEAHAAARLSSGTVARVA